MSDLVPRYWKLFLLRLVRFIDPQFSISKRFYLLMVIYFIAGMLMMPYKFVSNEPPPFYFVMEGYELIDNFRARLLSISSPTFIILMSSYGLYKALGFETPTTIRYHSFTVTFISGFGLIFCLFVIEPWALFSEPNINVVRHQLRLTTNNASNDGLWKYVQDKYHCCGTDMGNDWNDVDHSGDMVSEKFLSCCSVTGQCTNITTLELIGKCCYSRGCLTNILQSFYDYQHKLARNVMNKFCISIMLLCITLFFAQLSKYSVRLSAQNVPNPDEIPMLLIGNNAENQNPVPNEQEPQDNVEIIEVGPSTQAD